MKLGLGLGLGAMHCHAPQNPILSFPSIFNYTDFADQTKYTFSSGVRVQSVSRVKGSVDFTQSIAANQPDYDGAAFSGRGGLAITALSDFMNYNFGSGQAAQTLGVVLEIPAHAANRELVAFGNVNTAFSTAKLFHTGANRISYNRNEALSAVELINISGDGGKFILILRYNSAGSMEAYANALTALNLDPDDDAATLSYLYVGDNDAAVPGSKFAELFHCAEALSDSQIESVIKYWAGKYNITLL